jgi:exodeoxyribonuclease V alpha subunit
MNAATPECRSATEEISGLIERVTFRNDESGFCVLRVKTQGHREEMTVVGSLPSVTVGEWLVAEGRGGHGGAMDQRRQAGGEDDAAELPSFSVQ